MEMTSRVCSRLLRNARLDDGCMRSCVSSTKALERLLTNHSGADCVDVPVLLIPEVTLCSHSGLYVLVEFGAEGCACGRANVPSLNIAGRNLTEHRMLTSTDRGSCSTTAEREIIRGV